MPITCIYMIDGIGDVQRLAGGQMANVTGIYAANRTAPCISSSYSAIAHR